MSSFSTIFILLESTVNTENLLIKLSNKNAAIKMVRLRQDATSVTYIFTNHSTQLRLTILLLYKIVFIIVFTRITVINDPYNLSVT